MESNCERPPGDCPICGSTLIAAGDDPGDRPYWTCSTCVPSQTILPPRNLGYATALIGSRITKGAVSEDLKQFDGEAADPARFVDRIWDRIFLIQESIAAQEKQRRQNKSDATIGSPEDQSNLFDWS